MTLETSNDTHVFFSYARRDKVLRDQLEDHLSNLKYRGLITTWHDREIQAGEERARQIDIYLNNASIILLLISAHFMASEYCYGLEMKQAMERHNRGEAQVIPILLRPVLFTDAPFAVLQMLPTNGKPVVKWSDRDSAFVDIARGIERIALIYKETEKQLEIGTRSYGMPSPGATIPSSINISPDDLLSDFEGDSTQSPLTEKTRKTPFLPPTRFILLAEDGEIIQEYLLDKAEIRIGRAPDSDISLSKDMLISQHHATVRYENNQYILQDEQSTYGTLINGQQIEEMVPQVLYNGDYIGIGKHTLIFYIQASQEKNFESLNTIAVPFAVGAQEFFESQKQSEQEAIQKLNRLVSETTQVLNEQRAYEDVILRGSQTTGFNRDAGVQDPASLPKRRYYEDALKAYRDAIARDPSDSEAFRGLGNTYFALQRYAMAFDAFRQAIYLRPTAAAWAGIGNVLANLQQYQQAVEAYEEALQLDDEVTLDYDELVRALMALGRRQEAERYRERARELGYYDEE